VRYMKAIVDTREPDIVFRLLTRYYDKVKKVKLEYGDICGERIIVERKSVNDLVSTTFSGRLETQMLGLWNYAEDNELLPLVFVHGTLMQVEEYVSNAAEIIAGILAMLKVRYGFEVVWTPSLNEGIAVIAKVDRKIVEGKLGKPRKPRVRHSSITSRQAAIIATLFGLPLAVAERIVVKGGLRFLLTASDKELLAISGIGKKTLERIRRWLG